MMKRRAEEERKAHAPISSRVRAQPMQKPEGPIAQTPMHGVAMAGGAAREDGVIFEGLISAENMANHKPSAEIR